jgi:hypothetical protein
VTTKGNQLSQAHAHSLEPLLVVLLWHLLKNKSWKSLGCIRLPARHSKETADV